MYLFIFQWYIKLKIRLHFKKHKRRGKKTGCIFAAVTKQLHAPTL